MKSWGIRKSVRPVLILLILSACVFACLAQDKAPPKEGKVTSEYDRFKDLTTVTFDAQLSGDYPLGLSVRAVAVFNGESPTREPAKLIFAFLSAGEKTEYEIQHNLIFLADGERLKVDNSSYMKQSVRSGYIELIIIGVPVEMLRKVAAAAKAEAQLGDTEFALNDAQKANLKQFLTSVSVKEEAEGPDRPDIARSLEDYLRSGFGKQGYETSWYRNIVSASVKGSVAEVTTTLSEADYKAQRICGAVSGFVFSNTNQSLGLRAVRVLGDRGQVLIYRRELADPCR